LKDNILNLKEVAKAVNHAQVFIAQKLHKIGPDFARTG